MKRFVYSREEERWQAVEGVNITPGLPVIRTFVDHGTAFDQTEEGQNRPQKGIADIWKNGKKFCKKINESN